jgi:hypothetical protein
MVRLSLIPIFLFTVVLASCSGPIKEFQLESSEGRIEVKLFPDSSFVEMITNSDSSLMLAGRWSGGYEVGETLYTEATRKGMNIIENPIPSQYVFQTTGISRVEHAVFQSSSLFFDKSKTFDIDQLSASNSYPTAAADSSICNSWKIDSDVLYEIIEHARPVSGIEWHHLFGHYPCRYTGVLIQGGEKYEFSVNAGSWMYVSNADSTLILGSFDPKFDKHFVAPVWREEVQ